MGRHSSTPAPRRAPVVAAASAILLAGAGGGYALVRNSGGGSDPASASSSTSSAATSSANAAGANGGDVRVSAAGSPAATTDLSTDRVDCAKGDTVTLSVTRDAGPALKKVADQLTSQGDDCVKYDIKTVSSGIQLSQMTLGKKDAPQVWVPDSKVWLDTYNQRTKKSLDFGEVVATSPVAFAFPKMYVDAGAPLGAWTWAEFMSSTSHAAVPAMSDPEYSTASMLFFSSAHSAMQAAQKSASKAQAAQMAKAIEMEVGLMARNPRDEVELMELASKGSKLAASFPASEQQMLTQNKAYPDQKVSAVTVKDGTPEFAYGVVALSDDDTAKKAADALRQALRTQDGANVLQDAGFRVPGTASQSAESKVNGLYIKRAGQIMAQPDPKLAQTVQAMWVEVHRKMRLILAVDESGSMKQPATDKLSRIQLATGISLGALDQLKDDAEVGVWIFSENRGAKGEPWKEMSPIRPLASKDGGVTHRDALKGIARQLPGMPLGGTALYDTVLAAVKAVQADYDKDAVNSVVVWTDGVNRDADTISKEQLLTALRAEATSDKPVRVVLVGMGQKSDMKTLQEIAQASGGSAYYAADPAALQSVLAGAMKARIVEAGSAAGE